MGHTLILELPEDLYEPLSKKAQQAGLTPEELALRCLVTLILDAANDPVESFIGSFSSNISDWADQHDKYISETLTEQMCSKEEKGN